MPTGQDATDRDEDDTLLSDEELTSTLASLVAAAGSAGHSQRSRKLLRRAVHALRTSLENTERARNRYRALFDAVPDPVSILAEDGTVLDLNQAGMRAYRRPRDEVVGKNISVLNPDLPEGHLGPVWETLDRGGTYVIEVTNMRADGTRFPVEVHSANFDFDGRKSLVAVARDLSGRQEAELRYRELMEVVDKGIVVQDRKLQIVHINRAAQRILDTSENGMHAREELRLGRWQIVDGNGHEIDPEDLPPRRALRSGQVVESALLGLYHRIRKQMRWITVTSVPQFAAGSDQPTQVTSIFSDVTALKRDSALFDRVQSLAHIGGCEWDAVNDRLHLTEEAVRILSPAQPIHRLEDLLRCLREPDRRRLHAAIEACITTGNAFDLELQGTRHNGRSFWIRAIGEPDSAHPDVSRVTGTLQDISLDKLTEESLRLQASTDPLTGLINRDAILRELDRRLIEQENAGVAVLYIDLDRFKTVNDALGHNAGDEVLLQAAHRILAATNDRGMVARFGGDEFLVVCSLQENSQLAEQLADSILAAFAKPFRLGDDEFSVGASIGIAVAPDDGIRPQVLIQNADLAMYESKHRSRNTWQPFTVELARQQHDRLQIEMQLRRAADNNEFHLVYQPQVDLRRGHTVAAEALIRWQNYQLGELRPDLFIGHAETTGDIVRIGRWVLREACRQARQWREQGLGIVRIAVNVSYKQFAGDTLAAYVGGLLQEFDLPGSALELEFTERVLIEDAPVTMKTFAELRALGVILTIDDFGEGYSALNYLRRLPIHGLKISQLFTEGVPGNRSDVAVCQAVSAIARSLGLGLVAEGVESDAQRQFLLQLGVPIGQGFLFAPGLPADEFARRLAGMPVGRAAYG
ncbi:PAS domain S-box protein [Pseudoxanthomonas kalamensis DSM 18571]|uniref:sensor domain-containing protein n=1 Tax=Pseudoxanthomonas kalamensis TaxID=289483 RepID=UPI0013913B78|nr:EAL domain-containing protein [Pseudoxanthomonas kalamensis]KAF1708533.1 PAS domain S-box protein [Pseudoxanthomonas kalamensis DSM 18571]